MVQCIAKIEKSTRPCTDRTHRPEIEGNRRFITQIDDKSIETFRIADHGSDQGPSVVTKIALLCQHFSFERFLIRKPGIPRHGIGVGFIQFDIKFRSIFPHEFFANVVNDFVAVRRVELDCRHHISEPVGHGLEHGVGVASVLHLVLRELPGKRVRWRSRSVFAVAGNTVEFVEFLPLAQVGLVAIAF